jgi:hypothetical protein
MSLPTYRWNADKVAVRKIAGENVLIPIARDVGNLNSFFQLNPTATLIWEKALAGADEAVISRSLAETFTVDADRALADTRALLEDLVSLGALSPVEAH